MILRSLLLFLLLCSLTSCLPSANISIITEPTAVAPNKATLRFINQSKSDISLNLYTGYDALPLVDRPRNRAQYQQTLDYYERSNSLIKKQMIELTGLQKRAATYPPYMVGLEMQRLGMSFIRERNEWKRRYPLPAFYHKIVSQVRDRSFHAGFFGHADDNQTDDLLAIPSNRTVMIFIKEGRNKRVKELTHFVPTSGAHYELIYHTKSGETSLKQQSGKVQFYYGVMDLYEILPTGERKLVSSTDPNGALLNHPERFELYKYALLLKIFEQLVSYTQLEAENAELEGVTIINQSTPSISAKGVSP